NDSSVAVGLGGLFGIEGRYSNVGLFMDVDLGVPLFIGDFTGSSIDPIYIQLALGVNFYF
ncbi:MAG: hypothetical protein R2865_12645, partial [Deinococcales bacterium]